MSKNNRSKIILPAIFTLAITLPLLGGAFSYLINPQESSSVLGARESTQPAEILKDLETLSPNPIEVAPFGVETPEPEQQTESTPTNSGQSFTPPTNQPVQEPDQAEEREDLQPEDVEIIYEPEEVTTPPELPEEKIEYSPEEVKLFELSPDNIVGFTGGNIVHNSGNYPVNQPFTITLPDHHNQALINNLQFHPPANFTKSLNGNQLTITPLNQQRDTYYVFGMQHIQGCLLSNLPTVTESCIVNGNESWSFALGYTTAVWENLTYGTSVQGRPLQATKLGKCRTNDCIKIMLTGGLHGSEWRSGDLTQLINYIKNNPQEISGQDKEFLIAPFTNPDGTALNIRYNARNVNLNRNFPAYWTNENCPQCGSGPNSEPESQALHDLTYFYRPKFLISYHAQWPPYGIIFRGDDINPDTRHFAEWVADRTGYPIGEFPGFDVVPGDQTVWAEQQGIRSLIIEATYVANSDWDKNFNMYLALLREL